MLMKSDPQPYHNLHNHFSPATFPPSPRNTTHRLLIIHETRTPDPPRPNTTRPTALFRRERDTRNLLPLLPHRLRLSIEILRPRRALPQARLSRPLAPLHPPRTGRRGIRNTVLEAADSYAEFVPG